MTAPFPIDEATTAPVVLADASTALRDRWIVVLRPGSSATASAARAMVALSGGRVERSFGATVHGFSARLAPAEVERLRTNPDVAYIEQDARVHATGVSGQPWNLERIGMVPPELRVASSAVTGAGVHAYVIDTGVRTSHEEFGGRALDGFDAVDGGAADDCNGHGTHVAGTIGGASFGVARGVTLVSVRVLDCGGTGTVSGVIAGIDWVATHHEKPAVANLSIAGTASRAVDDALARAVEAGVVFVVAAGNDARDACGYSPARAPTAITVGATTRTDAVWGLSNQGSCVDLFAPGEEIASAWHTSDVAIGTLSGTSMAAPHVAGAAALLLQQAPDASPADVASALREDASRGALERLGAGSPDLLLHVNELPSWSDLLGWTR